MGDFKKDNNIMNGKGEDDIQWITVNGAHIPLKERETPQKAIEKQFKNTKNEPDANNTSETETVKMPKEHLKQLVNNILGFKPITMKINNKTIVAEFDKFSARKNIYGRGNSDFEGFSYKINNINKLPEYIQTSKYKSSKTEIGKDSPQHKGVKEWHYFINQIETNKGTFDITVNVRDKGLNQFIYEVAFTKKKPKTN